MAVIVEVLSPVESMAEGSGSATVIEVVRNTETPVNTTGSQAVIDVVGPGHVANAVVSTTPPANPYEGQIWIDVS